MSLTKTTRSAVLISALAGCVCLFGAVSASAADDMSSGDSASGMQHDNAGDKMSDDSGMSHDGMKKDKMSDSDSMSKDKSMSSHNSMKKDKMSGSDSMKKDDMSKDDNM